MATRPPRRLLRPLRWWWVLLGVSFVATSMWISTTSLLAVAGPDPGLRIDAIKTGLTVGAGTGGVVALLLAVRRQWLNERAQAHQEDVAAVTQAHQEKVAANTAHDATERRVTDLYTKAVDQLGSDKAAVRLGGLYSLECLAQNHPAHRRSIVNVVCAYLRMPFPPPAEVGSENAGTPATLTDDDTTEDSGPLAPDRQEFGYGDRHEELLVRSAAETLLTDHLRDRRPRQQRATTPPDPEFWENVEVDLTGATLVNSNAWVGCRLRRAVFTDAWFAGGANFAHTEFDTDVWFSKARFTSGSGHFRGAWFGNRAVFNGTDFGQHPATFIEATFCGMTFFHDVKLGGGTDFRRARARLDFDPWWGTERTWPPGWILQAPARPDGDELSGDRTDQNGWGLVVPVDGRHPLPGEHRQLRDPKASDNEADNA